MCDAFRLHPGLASSALRLALDKDTCFTCTFIENGWKGTEKQSSNAQRPFSYKQGLLGQVHGCSRRAQTREDFKAK